MREAFPGWEIEFKNGSRSEQLERPFRITFPPLKQAEEAPAKVEALLSTAQVR